MSSTSASAGKSAALARAGRGFSQATGAGRRTVREFRLTLLFTGAAMVCVVVAALVVNNAVGRSAEDNLIRIAEEKTARDALHLQAMMRTGQLVLHGVPPTGDVDRGHVMDSTVGSTPLTVEFLLSPLGLPGNFQALVEGLNIAKFVLFDLAGDILWSSDPALVGRNEYQSLPYRLALAGGVSSKLARQERLVLPNGTADRLDLVATYMPLRETPGGRIIGITALRRDVSSDLTIQVDDAKSTVLRTTVATMGGLFLVLVGFIVVADLTISRSNRRELAAAEEANLRLEHRVQQRTGELEQASKDLLETQGQLGRSEKLAAIGQLAGSVAHDLRNPLGAIKNAVYYLRGKLGSSEMAQSNPRIELFFNIVDQEILRSDSIITDLLTLGRADPPSFTPVDVAEAVDGALASVELRQTISVTKQFDPDLPKVQADEAHLHRVLTNLAGNAQDAMPEGGELDVRVRLVDGFVEVSVGDTGAGISDEDLKRVFDPLFTTKAKGTGLGLAICQQIVWSHGGSISVESTQGEGAALIVRLPANGVRPEGDFG